MIAGAALAETPHGHGSELRFVTVLFADLVGSSRHVIGRDPEAADAALRPLLHAMTEEITICGGTVVQVMGDGVLAAFGLPAALEDHAIRACHAANRIHYRLLLLNPHASKKGYPTSRARIGIDSGEVFASDDVTLGRERRLIGEPVYTAARLQQGALPGTTLISTAATGLTSGAFMFTRRSAVVVNMGGASVEAFQVGPPVSERAASSDPGSFRDAPLVGREATLRQLNQLLRGTKDRNGCTVYLTGAPGIGKSRLLDEVAGTARQGNASVSKHTVVAQGLFHLLEPTCHFLIDLLKLQPMHRAIPEKEAVMARMRALGLSGSTVERVLLNTFRWPRERQGDAGPKGEAYLSQLTSAIASLAIRMSQSRPLVVCVDDAQWADHGMREVLRALAEASRNEAIFLAIASREHLGEAVRGTHVREVTLDGIDSDGAAELIRRVASPTCFTDDSAAMLFDRTRGNPLFLLESVKDILTRVPAGHPVTSDEVERCVPVSVQVILASRIDRLGSADRHVLMTASVIGESFDVCLLEEMLPDLRPLEVRKSLRRLIAQGFVREAQLLPSHQFAFEHALVRDVAYGILPKRMRLGLHDRLIRLVRNRSRNSLPERTSLLAHHAFAAETWPLAAVFGLTAGRSAYERSRVGEAARLFSNALVALGRLPASNRNRARSIDACVGLARCQLLLGDFDSARRVLVRAERQARHLGDARRTIEVLSCATVTCWAEGGVRRAMRVARRAYDLARTSRSDALRDITSLRLGTLFVDRADYRIGCHLLSETGRTMPSDASSARYGLLCIADVFRRSVLARGMAETGDFSQALREGDAALMIAENAADSPSKLYALLNLGYVLARKGDFSKSVIMFDRALTVCQAPGMRTWARLPQLALGFALVNEGKVGSGLQLLSKAMDRADERTLILPSSLFLQLTADALTIGGNHAKAEAIGRRALEIAGRHGERGHEAWALFTLGILAKTSTSHEEHDTMIGSALRIARRRHMAPLVARCKQALACRSAGVPDTARFPRADWGSIRELDPPVRRVEAHAGERALTRGGRF